jgi:hypothetical protein
MKRGLLSPEERRFIGVPELRRRWNNCSQMLIEKRIKNDPNFPHVYRISRHRLFALDEIEAYERMQMVR